VSFEAELRLPGSKPYEYINIVIRGNDEREFDQDLAAVNEELVRKLTALHRMAADIVMARSAQAPKPATTVVVPEKDAATLVKEELGGVVVSETATAVKPWERAKPATTVSLFD